MRRALTILSTLVLSLTFLLASPKPAEASCHDANFSPSTYEVKEGAGHVDVRVMLGNGTRTPPQGCTGTVDYVTESGTADEGNDFTRKSGRLTFTQLDNHEAWITIVIRDDRAIESDESFTVKLTFCTGSITICNSQAVVTITDNDPHGPPPAPDGMSALGAGTSTAPASGPEMSTSPQAAPRPAEEAAATSDNPNPVQAGPRKLRAVAAKHDQPDSSSNTTRDLIGLLILLLGGFALALWKVRPWPKSN